jgi:AraC family transcriptional regulator
LFDMLANELAEAGAFAGEAMDSLARLILVRLARRQVGAASLSNPLTPMLQARLLDYIVSRLDRRLLVKDMAAVTGLAPSRFAQSFVRVHGQTPHQFVLRLRLERALQMLRGSTHALADIAAACGFASQQHMTQVMRRRLATTPARQRESLAAEPTHTNCQMRGTVTGADTASSCCRRS